MIRAFVALALASAATATASASTNDTLSSNSSWWEKVTVTISGDGLPQSCTFQSSLVAGHKTCDIDSTQASYAESKSSGSKDQYTRITFERRFSPGPQGEITGVGLGEKFLGGQVMALAIDAKGAVKGCKIVASSGSMTPDYSCDDAAAEKFDASASAGHANAPARQGYMTLLVYGHSEHMV